MNLALSCGVLLVVLNLLAGNIGDLSPQFRNYAAIVLWVPALISLAWPGFQNAKLRRKLLLLVPLAVIIAGFPAGSVHAVFALCASLVFLYLFGNHAQPAPPGLQVLLLAAAATGLWLIGQEVFPALYLLTEFGSSLSCRLSSLLARASIDFGPTYAGLPIFLNVVFLHLSVFVLVRPRKLLLLVGCLAAQLALLVGYQIAFHFLLEHWQIESPWVVLGASQWALLLLGLAPCLAQLRYVALQPATLTMGVKPLAWLGAAALLVFVLVADRLSPWLAGESRPSVLLYDDGTLDWSVPVYGQYSGLRGGMFGALAAFLQRHQCDAWRGPLTNLERANVLVVFNLMHKFRPEEKRQIWEFVARGGSLLAVGDHTGTTQIREPFNDLLEPVIIGFNFDSAMPIRRKWVNGLKWFPHPATANLQSAADTQIQVGASLSLRPPAEALVIGTHGWSDKGDLQNRANGYLGDRLYSVDERLGDVVLVATAKYQRGKVIVFGDTTSFQNSAAASDGDFVQAIFHSLTRTETPWVHLGAGLLLACAIGGALLTLLKRNPSTLSVGVGLFACVYVGYTMGALIGRSSARSCFSPASAGEAVIDTSHLSRCDPELWWPDGLGGLVQNLMRKQYLPILMPQFSPALITKSRLCFLVAPAKTFSRAESAVYEAFVRQGGELFVCVGYEDAGGSADLLRRFGLRLRNLPLGAIGPEANDARIHFLNAWPIAAEPAQAKALCRQGDYPLIVVRRLGKGRIVLIGDSGFLLNRNLEMAEAFNPENIEFFRQLVPAHE